MKTRIKIIYLFAFFTVFNFISCSNDDNIDYTITVSDVNFSTNENPNNGDSLGTITAISAASLNYTLISQTPSGAIALDSATGEITVADNTLFNFEVNSTITASITVANTAESETITATITINNISELNTQNESFIIDENPSNADIIGTLQATSSGSITYSIDSQSVAGAIVIDASSGEISVANASIFDFETNPTITANILASSLGETQTVTVTVNIVDVNEIGEFKFGGVIFWLNATNDSGYVVAMNNQSAAAPYGCMHTATGATGTAIGTGASNTNAILAICSTSGIAADLASNLTANGFNDWFLPSTGEVQEIMNNQAVINTTLTNNGGEALSVSNANFWTSTEVDAAQAKIYNYTNNFFPSDFKSLGRPVRAVRAF